MLRVSGNFNNRVAFSANRKKKDENPISNFGEKATLYKATVITGLGVGLRALWYLFEDSSVIEETWKYGKKIIDKNRAEAQGTKKELLHVGSWAAIVLGFITGVAALYTIYKTPEINYKSKVNTFVKSKDMDLYTKSNGVEKELYNQMNDKAKNATPEEKEELKKQYLKLKAAKNEVPESVKTSMN